MAASAVILLSYVIPLLAVLALPTPSSAAEADLFADLRAGICSQQRPSSEDPSQESKHNGARANCVLCKHPAAPAPDGLTTRVWQSLAWTRIRPQVPPVDSVHHDQTTGYIQPTRGPPLFSA
jgi:hypothetical protein